MRESERVSDSAAADTGIEPRGEERSARHGAKDSDRGRMGLTHTRMLTQVRDPAAEKLRMRLESK